MLSNIHQYERAFLVLFSQNTKKKILGIFQKLLPHSLSSSILLQCAQCCLQNQKWAFRAVFTVTANDINIWKMFIPSKSASAPKIQYKPVCFVSRVELSVGMLVSNNDTQGRTFTLQAMSNVDTEANEVFLKYSWLPQNETAWTDNAVYREILLLHVLLHLVLRSWCPNKNNNKAGEWNRSYYSARGCSSLIDQHNAFRSEHVSVKNLDFIMIQGANTEDIT